jgi:hypothetical protein
MARQRRAREKEIWEFRAGAPSARTAAQVTTTMIMAKAIPRPMAGLFMMRSA